MQIFSKVAGYSYGRADIVRRAMSKKKLDELIKEREIFIAGAIKNGVQKEIAIELFDEMESFAKYAFNKSHAAAYAFISYRTAYLKANYPREYYASLITSVLGSTDKMTDYIDECGKVGIRVLPPDINLSDVNFSVENSDIRFGLLALKSVGLNFISSIIEERKRNGVYESFDDFVFRLKDADINKRQVEALIKSGAFDSFGKKRSQLYRVYEAAIDGAHSISKTTAHGQLDITQLMTGEEIANTMPKIEYPDLPEFPMKDLLLYEREILGLCFSGHILDSYDKHLAELKPREINTILNDEDLRDRSRVSVAGLITSRVVKKTKNDENMAFVKISDSYGEIELVVFPNMFNQYSSALVVDNVIFVEGQISLKDEEPAKIILNTCKTVMQNGEYDVIKKPSSKLYLKVKSIGEPIVNEIIELLREYSGETEIIFFDISTKKYVRASNLTISASEDVVFALKAILGEDAVVLKN